MHTRAVPDLLLLLLLLRALSTPARLCKGEALQLCSPVHPGTGASPHSQQSVVLLQDVSGLDSSAATADILVALRYVALALSGCPGSSHFNAAWLITLLAVHAVP